MKNLRPKSSNYFINLHKPNSMYALTDTNFNFPNQKSVYKGKVRDVYNINDELLVMIASDRLSAFDVVMPKGIPYKGQILNQIATAFMKMTEDIVPNWLIATPDPNVAVGHLCEPFKVEMVIRGYLTGHAWREYQLGKRQLCGVALEEGLIPARMGKGNILKQFQLLAEHAGIPEKQTNAILSLMVSKSDQVKKLIDASFLNDRTKRSYLQTYQLKLKKLGE
jgi:phosphoribosylaminoimidazole-succinocarboxamide synthase